MTEKDRLESSPGKVPPSRARWGVPATGALRRCYVGSMETRPYFVFGDLLANSLAGALVGTISALVFGPAWNMILAMFVGMAIGMVLSGPPAFGFAALFGAMEVMVPVMTTGMVAGMVVSMAAAMGEVSIVEGLRMGTLSGVGVMVATYVANAAIKQRAPKWTS